MLVAESVDDSHGPTSYTWKGIAHKGMQQGLVGGHERLNRCKHYPDDTLGASTKEGASANCTVQILQKSDERKTPHVSGMKQRKKPTVQKFPGYYVWDN
jgi:hypothetical protein